MKKPSLNHACGILSIISKQQYYYIRGKPNIFLDLRCEEDI